MDPVRNDPVDPDFHRLMGHRQYRMFVAAAALLAGALVAAPIWDFWRYRAEVVAVTRHALGSGPIAVAGLAPPWQPARPEAVPAATDPAATGPAATGPAATVADEAIQAEATAAATRPASPEPRPSPPPARASVPRPAAADRGRGGVAVSTYPGAPADRGAVTPPAAAGRDAASIASASMIVAGIAPPAGAPAPAPADDRQPAVDPEGGGRSPEGPEGNQDETDESSGDGTAVTTVWIEPERRVAAPGRTVVVRVLVNAPQPLTSLPFHLLYDPAVLQFVAAREGAAYAGTSLQPILIGGTHPDRPGDVAVGLSFVGAPAKFGPRAEIAVLEFEGIAAGDTPLVLDRASARGPTGAEQAIQAGASAISVR
jgi:hypothetical protein